MEQRLELRASLGTDECVQFINDDVPQLSQKGGDLGSVDDDDRLERLWGDEQDPVRILEQLGLPRARHVAVPAVDRYPKVLAKLVQAIELVID